MSKLIQSALVAAVLLTGASAASARSSDAQYGLSDVQYDNAKVRSQIDLNSPEGAKAFWESVERNGR